jgi:pimeloyl-ACP methyl ester carboxylesterase
MHDLSKKLKSSEHVLSIEIEGVILEGNLILPENAEGLIVFVHGSGSSRHSPRNQYVANFLNQSKFGTFLFDLLTEEEEILDIHTGSLRFDIELLTERVIGVTKWLSMNKKTSDLSIGYFGASTGGAAALRAAARIPELVEAVVSRGGRPDLAGPEISYVNAPTLLIVGGDDPAVIKLNQQALKLLPCKKNLEIIVGASHLFEEPGALERVAVLAADWFCEHID